MDLDFVPFHVFSFSSKENGTEQYKVEFIAHLACTSHLLTWNLWTYSEKRAAKKHTHPSNFCKVFVHSSQFLELTANFAFLLLHENILDPRAAGLPFFVKNEILKSPLRTEEMGSRR